MIDSKIQIRLTSFNHEILNTTCDKLVKILENTNIDYFKIIPLPTHKRIYCVLRSPHVDKDAREHFEIRTHKRLVEVYYNLELCSNIGDLLADSKFPSGSYCAITFYD